MSSRSLNKVTLIGNLTRDPELKYTPQSTAVCTFGIATNRTWTTKTGETKEDVQFHRIVCWQKLAELSANMLAKGRKIYLEGRITYRSFEGKDGVQRQVTEIVMEDFIFCDDKRKASSDDQERQQSSSASQESTNATTDDDFPTEDSGEVNEKVDPDDIPF